jgi:manganese oxidase
MFHAHQSEFAELGWMSSFNVVVPEDFPAALAEVGLDEKWDTKARNSGAEAMKFEVTS